VVENDVCKKTAKALMLIASDMLLRASACFTVLITTLTAHLCGHWSSKQRPQCIK